MPTRAAAPSRAQLRGGAPQGGHRAFARLQQPQNLAQQHRLAGARAAHDGQHFAPVHCQVQILVHGKGVARPRQKCSTACRYAPCAHPAGRRGMAAAVMAQNPTSLKAMANSASTTITMVMDADHRGRRARAQALGVGLHAQAPVAADQRNEHPKHHRLGPGQPQVADLHRLGSACQKVRRRRCPWSCRPPACRQPARPAWSTG